MSEEAQQLFPCPVCGRKFVKKSLEVHLRSCDKKGKYKGGHNIAYDNQAFLDKLDKAMEQEKQHSQYKPSQKKKTKKKKKKIMMKKQKNQKRKKIKKKKKKKSKDQKKKKKKRKKKRRKE